MGGARDAAPHPTAPTMTPQRMYWPRRQQLQGRETLPPKVFSRSSHGTSWFNFYLSPCGDGQEKTSAWGLGQQAWAKSLFQRSSAQPNGRGAGQPPSLPSRPPGLSSLRLPPAPWVTATLPVRPLEQSLEDSPWLGPSNTQRPTVYALGSAGARGGQIL